MKTQCLVLLGVLAIAATLQAQDYTWTTNNGTITITGYTGPGGGRDHPQVIRSFVWVRKSLTRGDGAPRPLSPLAPARAGPAGSPAFAAVSPTAA